MSKVSDILKTFRKNNGSCSAAESNMAKVTEFLDTGSYAINRVLTGDISKGFPMGRISTVYGESGSGKSLLAANAIIDALKNKNFQSVVYVDSEGGALWEYIENSGVDLNRIEHVPVNSIEDCGIKLIQLYDALVKARNEWKNDATNNDEPRVLVVLDSYGALSSDKLTTDALKDKMSTEMGISAKQKNNMLRGLMMRVVQSNCPMIIINHTYSDPSAMFSSKIKAIPGGEGIKFASHVMLQMTKLLVKTGDTEFLTGKETVDDNSFYKGNRIRAFCVKNRVAKPCFEATMFIDFSTGISKYDGLIEDAVQFGFIQEVRGGYIVPSYSDKKVTYRELVSNEGIWNTFIEDFNKKSIDAMGYSNGITNELDKIELTLGDADGISQSDITID